MAKPHSSPRARTKKPKAKAYRSPRDHRAPPRRRASPRPRVTDPVLGLRCRVVEIHSIDDSIELMADPDGRRIRIPLPALVEKEAFDVLKHGDTVWITVRMEAP